MESSRSKTTIRVIGDVDMKESLHSIHAEMSNRKLLGTVGSIVGNTA
jgi:hypothetical protein